MHWITNYRRQYLLPDLLGGAVAAIMLVPQAMAYAALAGLPPQYGFYASIAPPIVYALTGSSMTLAVGPTAIIALMVSSALEPLQYQGSEYIASAGMLALLTGAVLMVMFILRMGNVVKFVSQPVLIGFLAGSAILIIWSQLPALLGPGIANSRSPLGVWQQIEMPTVLLSLISVVCLWAFAGPLRRTLAQLRNPLLSDGAARSGPLLLMAIVITTAWLLNIPETRLFDMIGTVPPISLRWVTIRLDWGAMTTLLPSAALIALVIYLESISIAKLLGAKRRQRISPNRELIALSGANFAAAVSGGFPVAGSFGRSSVNFAVGSQTPLASIITSVCMLAAGLLLAPLFFYLPKALLAAIIVVSIYSLISLREVVKIWRYDKGNGVSLVITLIGVIMLGVEQGMLLGVSFSIILLLIRTSRPHVAIVGRVPNTEHFRNIHRHDVETLPHVLAMRVDESLYFANAQFLEDYILSAIAERNELRHVVLICSGVNYIDASALESLERVIDALRASAITTHMTEVKGPVMDQLEHSDFRQHLQDGRIFLSTHAAMQALADD
jgi:SulP family sulfate permease